MPSPGSESATAAERPDRLEHFMMVHLHVELHHLVECERIHLPGDRHANGVAQKIDGVMVGQEALEFVEDVAFVRFFDVGLEFGGAVLARRHEQRVQHFQSLQVQRLVVAASLEDSDQPREQLGDGGHRIGDEQRS